MKDVRLTGWGLGSRIVLKRFGFGWEGWAQKCLWLRF